ncbi:MAG: Maf family protein [Aquidulcibacter sp.]|jgi:septum formation protein|uniref:Maf family protein n=1 Tax=Aquidulcibacter sp. TaxID=2052990 RepID=UPI0022C97F05|nr:Maf family protein [Aquidulcibacter sp.]MCE2890413.1 Maf family protein [Hyphomonadaceae bacterium]MCZ8206978.1 Maf family protein [Aquidulcibacter sp.]
MLTLASTSAIRRHLLTQAGINFEAVGSGVDEDAVKESMRAEGASPRNQADKLAELKALKVSQRRPGFVLGCDQILSFEGHSFDKAENLDEAFERLSQLRGRTHSLECAAVIAKDGQAVWRLVTSPKLTMRDFSDDFLRSYLKHHGQEALSSVGCYQFEGPGAQLFERVEGDFFSILGLPLLEVLAFLRLHGEVPT